MSGNSSDFILFAIVGVMSVITAFFSLHVLVNLHQNRSIYFCFLVFS